MSKSPKDNNIASYTDEELLVQLHSGQDSKYAGELYKRYTHLVFGICMKYLKNKANSKDVLMNIFEIFLKKPPAEDIISFKKWLFTVTKHECLTFIRNDKRSSNHYNQWKESEKKAEIFMENEDVWSLNSKTRDEIRLQKALEKLKEPQEICIRLFYIEGKSYKEIEAKTDFALNQIKSYLQNGKRKLKLLLESSSI